MPKKEGERAAREPRRYRLELDVGLTRARFLIPELDLANPPATAAWNGPAGHILHQHWGELRLRLLMAEFQQCRILRLTAVSSYAEYGA